MVSVGAGAWLLPHCPTIVSIYFINYISTARPSELPRKEEEGEIILKYLKCLCHGQWETSLLRYIINIKREFLKTKGQLFATSVWIGSSDLFKNYLLFCSSSHSPVIIFMNSLKSTVPELSSSTSVTISSSSSSLRSVSISRSISFRTSVLM